jgi:hypothetical protein
VKKPKLPKASKPTVAARNHVGTPIKQGAPGTVYAPRDLAAMSPEEAQRIFFAGESANAPDGHRAMAGMK